MKRNTLVPALFFFFTLAACSTGYDPDSPEKAGDPPSANARVRETMDALLKADPSMQRFFDNSYGYAIFWKIGKGGAGVGGARGDGLVYEHGRAVGKSTMTQATIGLQLGGQTYREVVFFRDQGTFRNFQGGKYAFSADASAVAAQDGASAAADYRGGVAVFTHPIEGLRAEASVGGQKFSYEPLH
jgi:lipid-binding SYLF domain-containing protein